MTYKAFKNLKGRHALKFRVEDGYEQKTLADTQPGDTFLRNGAICMRLLDRLSDEEMKSATRDGKIIIVNLQTANCWAALPSDEITMIDAELIIVKTYNPREA